METFFQDSRMCIARSGRSSQSLRSLYERTHFDYRWYKALTGDIHAMHIPQLESIKKMNKIQQLWQTSQELLLKKV